MIFPKVFSSDGEARLDAVAAFSAYFPHSRFPLVYSPVGSIRALILQDVDVVKSRSYYSQEWLIKIVDGKARRQAGATLQAAIFSGHATHPGKIFHGRT
jgi:hypothetical protein